MVKPTATILSTLLYMILFLLAVPLQGEIFRWVDKQGQVHFSDADNLPEKIRNAEPVDVEPNIVEVRPGLTATRKPPSKQNKSSKNRQIGNRTDIVTSIQQDRAKCRLARANLGKVRQQLRAGYTARQYRRLHDREIRYMDDRQRYCH